MKSKYSLDGQCVDTNSKKSRTNSQSTSLAITPCGPRNDQADRVSINSPDVSDANANMAFIKNKALKSALKSRPALNHSVSILEPRSKAILKPIRESSQEDQSLEDVIMDIDPELMSPVDYREVTKSALMPALVINTAFPTLKVS